MISKIRVFGHYLSGFFFYLALLEGFIFIASFSFIHYWMESAPNKLIEPLTTHVITGMLMVLGLATTGLYREKQREKLSGVLKRLAIGYLFGLIAVVSVSHGFTYFYDEKAITLQGLLLSFALIVTLRIYVHGVMDRENIFRRKVLALGAGRKAATLLQLRRKSDRRGFNLIGFINCPGDETSIERDKILDVEPGKLPEYVMQERIDEIIVTPDDRRQELPLIPLLECRLRGVKIVDLSSFLEREAGKVLLGALYPSWLIFSDGFQQSQRRVLVKRLLDIICSVVLIIVSAPLMLVTALAILYESRWRGDVFYRQTRVGLNGAPVTVMKFRSMTMNAEAAGKAQWAQIDDPRVTRVGKYLRKYRIDELPQLFNVLRGDMSMVGPRPERPEFVHQLSEKIPYYDERHRVKPGLTGWAQLMYPYGSDEKDALEKLQFDLYYVKNNSWFLDLMILVYTVEVVLFKKGSR